MKFLILFVFLSFSFNSQSEDSIPEKQDFDEKVCELSPIKKDPLTGFHIDNYINLENIEITSDSNLLDLIDLERTINIYNRQICEIDHLINKLKYTYVEPNYLIITAELSVWLYTSDQILSSLRKGGVAAKGEIVGESNSKSTETEKPKAKLKLYERVKILTEGLGEVFKGEKDVFGAFFNQGGSRAVLFSILYAAVSYDLYRRFSSGFSISKNDLDLMVFTLEETKIKLQKQARLLKQLKNNL